MKLTHAQRLNRELRRREQRQLRQPARALAQPTPAPADYGNPNPRLGVFLDCAGASVRLRNVLLRNKYQFGHVEWGGYRTRGLKRFVRDWPQARLLKHWPNFGKECAAEFCRLLAIKRPNVAALWTGGAPR